jgi:hypothetical protein
MSYHKVGYQTNGVDLADYFPAYEITQLTIPSGGTNVPTNGQWTITLTKNVTRTTNYISIIQPYYSTGSYNKFLLSSNIIQFLIRDKIADSYGVWMSNINSLTGSEATIILWCVTFYTHQTERAFVSGISNYNVNGVSYNLCNYFPQFAVHINTNTVGSITNSLTTKNTTSTNYLNFGSVTFNNVTSISAKDVKKIMYFENTNTRSSSNFYIRLYSDNTNITVNTITMYLPTSINNTLGFSNYNVDNVDLDKIFPRFENFFLQMYNASDNREWTFSLAKNTRETTDYVVLTSYVYFTEGTGLSGTYSALEASINAGMPIISAKSATSFIVSTRTPKGESWYGGMNLLVIYY